MTHTPTAHGAPTGHANYDVEAARIPIPDDTYQLIRETVPQEGIVSDGNLDQWLDEDAAEQ